VTRSVYGEHAWLYDAAFSWDVGPEAAWLHGRLGPAATSLLEPACGSGRVLVALARRGLRVAGFDASPLMLERAATRFADDGLEQPRLVVADLADCGDLDLGGPFDGAVLPVGTLGYLLTDDAARRHLAGVARHLRPGAKYLVQEQLVDLARHGPAPPGPTSRWDTPSARGTVRCCVSTRSWDARTRREGVVARYEVLDGPEAGTVVEEEQAMRAWDWASWSALVEASPFRQVAAWDGNADGWPPIACGPALEGRPLAWHELERR